MMKNFINWALRLVPAIILLQTLFFKFTAHPDSVAIFSKLHAEPFGRIFSGVLELITAIMILTPKTTFWGAIFGFFTMIGAILSHVFIIGIDTNNDGGKLFFLAVTVIIFCIILIFKFKKTKMYSNNSSIFMLLLDILTEQQNALRKISPEIYTFAVPSLDGASIGGHVRHSIEFLEILLNSYSTNIINYEKRKRNIELEKNPEEAINAISNIISNINLPNKNLILQQTLEGVLIEIPTNFYREIVYNIEHCIHHQALIKVAFKEMKIGHLIHKNFGVAPSTIQYRETQNTN